MKIGLGLALVIGIALGVGAVKWFGNAGAATAAVAESGSGASLAQTAQGKTLQERVAALEAALDQSASTQLDLFDQLLRLEGMLEDQLSGPAQANPGEVEAALARRDEVRRSRRSRDPTDYRREQLLNYGFDEEMAARITEREGELRMDLMRQRYEARYAAMEGREPPANPIGNYTSQLREEFGDDVYDRYLYASGRSNRVTVNGVISTSPGAKAGLKQGDVILSYDGQRVFRMDDIVRLTHQGDVGETVGIEIKRADGGRETLYLPRGPIGMWGGGRNREDPDK